VCWTVSGFHSMTMARPVRVLCIKDQISDSGGSAYFLRTLPLLDPQRVQVTMCALRPRHWVGDRFDAAGIPTRFLGRSKWDPRALIDVRRQIRLYEPDVVHIEGRKTLLVGRLAARQLGVPSIVHFHEMLPLSQPMGALQRRLARCTTKALAVSEAVRAFAIRKFAIPPERIDVLYNGLDLTPYRAVDNSTRARIRRELGIDDAQPVIGMVGRMIVANKGQDVMLRAMSAVLARRPDAVLALVGDGPDLETCRALAAELGVAHASRFLEHRDDVPDVLAAIDVAAMPSMRGEGLPFVVLEAMAAGRPVVGFRIAGVPEMIRHDEDGILVDRGDVAGLADGLTRLIEDGDLYRRMADSSRARAQDFAMGHHVSKLTTIYEDVAARRAASEPAR
jgi:glycosyltransferase involved in cell wall biosynthesis